MSMIEVAIQSGLFITFVLHSGYAFSVVQVIFVSNYYHVYKLYIYIYIYIYMYVYIDIYIL